MDEVLWTVSQDLHLLSKPSTKQSAPPSAHSKANISASSPRSTLAVAWSVGRKPAYCLFLRECSFSVFSRVTVLSWFSPNTCRKRHDLKLQQYLCLGFPLLLLCLFPSGLYWPEQAGDYSFKAGEVLLSYVEYMCVYACGVRTFPKMV